MKPIGLFSIRTTAAAIAITHHKYDLGPLAVLDQPAGRGARKGVIQIDYLFLKFVATTVAKPAAATDDVRFAVTIHVQNRQPLMLIFSLPGWRLAPLFRLAADVVVVDLGEGPCIRMYWVCRGLGDEQAMGVLVPKDDLRATTAVQVGCYLVVVLGRSGVLDGVALPRLVEVRVGVPPPPDLVALPVAGGDKVQVAVAIDVQGNAPASICSGSGSMTEQVQFSPRRRYITTELGAVRSVITKPG